MRASEILRQMADVIDHQQQGPENSNAHAELDPVAVDNTDHTDTATMVPPLQRKLELLKQVAGADSYYADEQTGEQPCECCGQCPCRFGNAEDELSIIKRNAGMPIAIQIATDGPTEL